MTYPVEAICELPRLITSEEIQNTIISPSVVSTLYEIKDVADSAAEKSRQLFKDIEENLSKAPIDTIFNRVHKIGTQIERTFNILGCIPFIGSSSGSLRAALGHLQILAGAILAATGEIGVFVSKMRNDSGETAQRWKKVSILGSEQILHGCLNIIRGYGESLLGHYSLGLANIVLLMPNAYKEDAFSPYFAYGAFKA